ncbi:hypothetical protein [Mycolicibacterium baixiangningiae]|uniref:hypothetical protein n=1 Tax=Mycolicibacterium baixiangningiae TaxID=2761578 RepID=UPI0018692573|nr:hypothetical protein [Mycolicibacterium baixiangningiae]
MSTEARTALTPPVATLVTFERQIRRPRLILTAVACTVVGAVLGALLFALRAPDVTATAFIRITQPADLAAVASGADYSTPDTQAATESYVAGEVAYLSGEGFAQAVSTEAGDTEVVAQQVGGSSVVELSSVATSEHDARAAVQTAIDVYGRAVKERADGQLRSVLPTLDQWQTAATLDPLRTAEIARLREGILVQAQSAGAVTVLQPPTVDDNPAAEWITGAAVGAVGLGGAVAGLSLARRRRSPSLVSQIAQASDGVLIPPVNLRLPESAGWGAPQVALARTLSAQIGAANTHRTVVIVGLTPESGTDVVAALLEVAAADHRPSRDPDDHLTSIIDAGAIGTEPLSDLPIEAATHIVVVVRIDVDDAAAVVPVFSAAAGYGVSVLAAFTFRPWWQRRRTIARPMRRTETGAAHRRDQPTASSAATASAAVSKAMPD